MQQFLSSLAHCLLFQHQWYYSMCSLNAFSFDPKLHPRLSRLSLSQCKKDVYWFRQMNWKLTLQLQELIPIIAPKKTKPDSNASWKNHILVCMLRSKHPKHPQGCLPKLRPPKNRMVFTQIPSLISASKSILVYSKQRIHVIMYTKESLLPASKLQKSKINPPHWLIYHKQMWVSAGYFLYYFALCNLQNLSICKVNKNLEGDVHWHNNFHKRRERESSHMVQSCSCSDNFYYK